MTTLSFAPLSNGFLVRPGRDARYGDQRVSQPARIPRYRRGTARRTMLINSCYVSRLGPMEIIKATNSKSGIQGHSVALAMVPFDRPHTISN